VEPREYVKVEACNAHDRVVDVPLVFYGDGGEGVKGEGKVVVG